MVKIVEAWECETCLESYLEKDLALTCEKWHLDGDKMVVQDVFYKTPNQQFPDEVLIECENHSGILAHYRKIEEGSVEEFTHLYPRED